MYFIPRYSLSEDRILFDSPAETSVHEEPVNTQYANPIYSAMAQTTEVTIEAGK